MLWNSSVAAQREASEDVMSSVDLGKTALWTDQLVRCTCIYCWQEIDSHAIIANYLFAYGERSIVVVKALRYKPEGRELETRCGELIFSISLGPGVYSASNRNEYKNQKNNVPGEYSAAAA
jgi:hypothetical protein